MIIQYLDLILATLQSQREKFDTKCSSESLNVNS